MRLPFDARNYESNSLAWLCARNLGSEEGKRFFYYPSNSGLIMTLIDELADRDKGKDVSRVYFELWCRNFDEAFIEIADEEAMAFASGFTAPNRERPNLERAGRRPPEARIHPGHASGVEETRLHFPSRSPQGHQEVEDRRTGQHKLVGSIRKARIGNWLRDFVAPVSLSRSVRADRAEG